MATATLTQTETVVLVPAISVTLTEDEAITLGAILSRVGGAEEGYRGHAQAILQAILLNSGLSELMYERANEHIENHAPMDGALYFNHTRD